MMVLRVVLAAYVVMGVIFLDLVKTAPLEDDPG
jgi:hypothetical protein